MKLLIFKTFEGAVLLLDGDDDGREYIEINGTNLENCTSAFDLYGGDSGIWVVEVVEEKERVVRALTTEEFSRLNLGLDVLINIDHL